MNKHPTSKQGFDELSPQHAQPSWIFEHALACLSDLIYLIDREGRFLYANQPLLDLWGIPLEEAVGKGFLDLGYPLDLAARLQRQIESVFTTRTRLKDETHYVSPTGTPGFYEYILNPIISPQGEVEGVVGSTRVITERKRSEEHTSFLSHLGQRLALLSDCEELVRETTQSVGQYLAADRCYICEWDADLGWASVANDWKADVGSSLTGSYDLSDYGPKEWWQLLTAGNVAIEDFEKHPLSQEFLPNYQALQIRSYATARFLRDGPGMVTLVVTMKAPRKWRPDELSLLENVIARAWPLIERTREQRHQTFLSHLSQRLSTLSTAEDLTRVAIEAIGEHLGLHRCYFFEAVEGTDRVRVSQNWRHPSAASIEGEYALLDFGTEGWWHRVKAGRVFVDDVRKEPQLDRERYGKFEVRSYATVPFQRENRWVAGLAATSNYVRRWTEGELTLLENIIARVWPVVDQARVTAALRQSAERLSLAISAANLGDFSWDAQTDTMELSPRAAEIFGQPHASTVTRSQLRQLLHEEDRDRARHANERAMMARSDYDIEYRLRLPSGGWRWIAAKGRGIYDAQGAPIGMRGVVQDITSRKMDEEKLHVQEVLLRAHASELEQRVAERTASLQEAVSQMEEFSYSVSHDLRGPLRAMNMYAQALMEDYADQLDDTAKGYLERIRRSSDRMEKLTRDVLTYSRVARSQVELAPLDLDKLLCDVVNQYIELQPPQAIVEWTKPLYPVLGHEASLGQCLGNLLSNAAKFVNPGVQPHIRIWTEARNGRVRLWVADNGIGIRPELQGRLFHVFERLPTTGHYVGTGIGLAIVRKAMEKMSGQCGVESDGQHGSRFWLEFAAA